MRALLFVAVLCLVAPCWGHTESNLFYCDTAATLVGSSACSILSDIDPYYPVDIGVGVDGLPIIFYAPTPVNTSDQTITKRYILCENVDCTEVQRPRDLTGFNGLFGVDTLLVETSAGRQLLVAGVGNIVALSVPLPLAEYVVITGVIGADGHVSLLSTNYASAINPQVDPKLVRLTTIKDEESNDLPAVFFYTAESPNGPTDTDGLSNYKHGNHIREEQLNFMIPTSNPFGFTVRLQVSTFSYGGSGTDNIDLWVNAARALSNFHGDFPWSNNEFGFFQYVFNTRMRQSGNSPFSLDHPLPRLHVHSSADGNVFVGVQSMQRIPLSRVRGTDMCLFFQEQSGTNPNDVEAPFGGIAFDKIRTIYNPVVQNVFSGTTSVKFLLLPFSELNDDISRLGTDGQASSTVPKSSSSFQYNGLSSGQTLQLIDSVVQDTFTSLTCKDIPGSPITQASPPPIGSRRVVSDEAPQQKSELSERYLAYSGIVSAPGSLSSLSLPHTLVTGLANNGFPAVLGVVTSTTGEPMASGWSIVLTVCLDGRCDQQVSRYLMDSSTLHDNWGIMDDPFASVNSLINHPDGTLTIVLFVQPQGEQTSRLDGASSLRGEGSSGKPLFITCMDDTCATAYVSAECPNRLQTSMPVEYYAGGQVVVTNRPHSFSFVGENSESLLVSVRDVPLAFQANNSYSPVAVRLWRTNRYASPTGSPCTPHAVGSTALVDSTLYICTRLNVGHDLANGGIDGWVRYYEWVDVGHSFAARLWANLPASRSPLDLTENIYTESRELTQVP